MFQFMHTWYNNPYYDTDLSKGTLQTKTVSFTVPANSTSASYTVSDVNEIVGFVSCLNNFYGFSAQSWSFTGNTISVSGWRSTTSTAATISIEILYK